MAAAEGWLHLCVSIGLVGEASVRDVTADTGLGPSLFS